VALQHLNGACKKDGDQLFKQGLLQ